MPKFLTEVIQLNLCIFRNFSFLIASDNVLLINVCCEPCSVLSVTILACRAFLLHVMMVQGAWSQLFSPDLIININIFMVCKVPPFLRGHGIPSFHFTILRMCKGVKFQVFKVLSTHLTATQKDLVKYV